MGYDKMKKIFIGLLILLLCGCSFKKYTVTFMDEDLVLATIKVKAGDNLRNVAKPTKEGYIFVSWLDGEDEYDEAKPIDNDITLKASWTKEPTLVNYHTVTFNFGNFKKTQTVRDKELAVKPSFNPTLEKHEFVGWYLGDTLYDFTKPVTGDITINAKFKRSRITINYDLNCGTGSTKQIEIDIGSIPSKPKDPSKIGYDFLSWQLDGKPYNFDFPLYNDVTIKAYYEATIYYTVTFDTDGGNVIPNEVVAKGKTLTKLPEAIKEGYTFKYWQDGDNEFTLDSKINDDIVLVALYEKNEE